MRDKKGVMTMQRNEVGWMGRLLWFVLVGWWATFIWINVAWALNTTIIFLPLGLWMINRVPQIMTLHTETTLIEPVQRPDGSLRWHERAVAQEPFVLRALWFALIGWWLSFFWANLAWAFATTIIGLPVGIWMLNRLPTMTTLRRI